MQWMPLNEALLPEAFAARELETLTEARHNAPQDPVPGICAGLAARIRNAVLAGGRAGLSGSKGENDIPLALRGEAAAILRYKLLVRFALAVTDERKEEAARAEQRLDDIAKGVYPLPDDTVATSPTYHGRAHCWRIPSGGGIM